VKGRCRIVRDSWVDLAGFPGKRSVRGNKDDPEELKCFCLYHRHRKLLKNQAVTSTKLSI
jgi:hypothetical protein